MDEFRYGDNGVAFLIPEYSYYLYCIPMFVSSLDKIDWLIDSLDIIDLLPSCLFDIPLSDSATSIFAL